MKTGRYLEAADLWQDISERHSIYNGLTEGANAFVRMGQFSKFARIRTSWMTDLAPKPVSRSPTKYDPHPSKYYHDEFDVRVAFFYARHQPYRSLLKSGFSLIRNDRDNQSVYSNKELHPTIRFLAAEPILKRHLLKRDYQQFLSVSGKLFDSEFEKRSASENRDKDGKLILAYRALIPKIRTLTSNQNDPEALTSLGYFLYSRHRFPRCRSRTLWSDNLGLCKGEPTEQTSEIYTRPIDLFSRALRQYSIFPERTAGEARLLRIMIYCFQSWSNKDKCVRGPSDKYSKSVRRGYFQRLHKYFPQAAKQTPYWY